MEDAKYGVIKEIVGQTEHQEHAAAALQEMAAPQALEVHVTVDDVVLKE